MPKSIIIPVEDQNGLDSKIAQHFGRAPFFAIIELNDKGEVSKINVVANTGEHLGGTGHPHEKLLAFKPDVIVACGMGPGGLMSFQNAGVTVLKAMDSTVKETIASFKKGRLKELEGGCEHAHHQHQELR